MLSAAAPVASDRDGFRFSPSALITLNALALLLVRATGAAAAGLTRVTTLNSVTPIGDTAAARTAQSSSLISTSKTPRRQVTLQTVTVAAPNNAAVWMIPFYNAV